MTCNEIRSPKQLSREIRAHIALKFQLVLETAMSTTPHAPIRQNTAWIKPGRWLKSRFRHRHSMDSAVGRKVGSCVTKHRSKLQLPKVAVTFLHRHLWPTAALTCPTKSRGIWPPCASSVIRARADENESSGGDWDNRKKRTEAIIGRASLNAGSEMIRGRERSSRVSGDPETATVNE